MIGDIMCFESTSTDVAIELTLLPLSFRSSIMSLTSFGLTGVRRKEFCTLFVKYEAASFCVGAILDVN